MKDIKKQKGDMEGTQPEELLGIVNEFAELSLGQVKEEISEKRYRVTHAALTFLEKTMDSEEVEQKMKIAEFLIAKMGDAKFRAALDQSSGEAEVKVWGEKVNWMKGKSSKGR